MKKVRKKSKNESEAAKEKPENGHNDPEDEAVVEAVEEEEAVDEDAGKVADESEDANEDGDESEDASEDDDEDGDESEDASEDDDEANSKSEKTISLVILNPAYDGLLPASLLSALIGALLGLIPATLFTYITGTVFYPFFIAAPLLAFLFNSLLKGGRDIRALIATAVFSLLSAYVTAVSCQAALYTAIHNMSILQIPLLTSLAIGKSGVLPPSASAYAYALVFTVFGVVVTWELFKSGVWRTAGLESDDEDESEDDESDDDPDFVPDDDNVPDDEPDN